MLQHEIRLAGGGDARIEQTRDVRVGQAGQNAALAPEPLLARPAEETQVQDLDGSLALESAVAPPGEPHAAHSSLADPRETVYAPIV